MSKILSQTAALALIAKYREDRNNYNTSSKEVTAQLINELKDNTYKCENSNGAINALIKQRAREDAKLNPLSSTND